MSDTIDSIANGIRYAVSQLGDDMPYIVMARQMRSLADDIVAAHKREVDALKQRVYVLNAEVAEKDKVIKRLNGTIAEWQSRKMATTENSSVVGNAAKLREAVGKILWCLKWMFDNTDDKSVQSHLGEPIALAKAALAAPARNCDVGTVTEQDELYVRYCKKHRASACNPACPLYKQRMSGVLCSLVWAQMPYEEGGTK